MTPSYIHRYEGFIMLASPSWFLYKNYPGDEGYGPIVQDFKYHKTFCIWIKRSQRQKKLMKGAREFIPLFLLNEK